MTKLLVGKNDLATVKPKLLEEWDYEENDKLGVYPDKVLSGSVEEVWWKCSKGHRWKARISHRSNGVGCPICSNRKILVGYNDLASQKPELAQEWDYEKNGDLLPTQVVCGSFKKVWWVCSKGHEWQATVNDRNKGKGCPYCSGRLAIKGKNDLAMTHPELAQEWNHEKNGNLLPTDVVAGSGKIVWWRCREGHEWRAIIRNRLRGEGCPICSNHQVIVGYNDLQTTHPKLVEEWNYGKNGILSPTMFPHGSEEKVWWKCKNCGHEWLAAIVNRTHGRGCPKCAHAKIGKHNAKLRLIKGVNDLGTLYPVLCLEWLYEKNKGITPFDVLPGSGKKVWWRCSVCGHEWQTRIEHRTNGSGCPNCVRLKRKKK